MSKQAIIGYHLDDVGDWVAQLACGHNQHVRHQPPWIVRQWVITAQGRQNMIGHMLRCKKCEEQAPKDEQPVFIWHR